jgi:hypothetical protein
MLKISQILLVFTMLHAQAQSDAILTYIVSPSEQETLKSWAVEWLNWAFKASMAEGFEKNPQMDSTGENCGVAQSGEVWFLTDAPGIGGQTVNRTCVIPQGKFIFFPIHYWQEIDRSGMDCKQLQQSAAAQVEASSSLSLEMSVQLNGVTLQNVEQYRVTPDSCIEVLGRNSALDGYWILLQPLPQGTYPLSIKVTKVSKETDGNSSMTMDVSPIPINYTLVVQ